MRSQENDIVSATKAIIETHIYAMSYYNYFKRTIKNTTIRVHYTMATNVKANCGIYELPKVSFPLITQENYI